jgi:outer membrane protein OmpA-like peptidoglycan-associated protein
MFKRRRILLLWFSALLASFVPSALSAASPAANVGNGAGKATIVQRVDFTALENALADSAFALQRIVVSGYASPDGSYSVNAKLARRRANQLKKYLTSYYNLPAEKILVRSVAEDWEGVESFIDSASIEQLPGREAMLKIVRGTKSADAKERLLRRSYPKEFRYLMKYCMPQLRRASYTLEQAARYMPEETADSSFSAGAVVQADTVAEDASETFPEVFGEVLEDATGPVAEDTAVPDIADADVPVTETVLDSSQFVLPFEAAPDSTQFALPFEAVSDSSQFVLPLDAAPDSSQFASADKTVPRGAPSEDRVSTSEGTRSYMLDDDSEFTETDRTDLVSGDASVSFLINESEMRADYNLNQQYLDKITNTLDKVFADPSIRILGIDISGYASPDGPYALNVRLADRRMARLKSYIMSRYDISDSLITTQSTPEDWEGLEQLVLNSSADDLPHKDALLDIIRSDRSLDAKERAIRRYSSDFLYLKRSVLPRLRRSEYVIRYARHSRTFRSRMVMREKALLPPVSLEELDASPQSRRPLFVALKTNLLYDAALVPNIGVEVSLGRRWTLVGDWFYTWFKSDARHRYWQGYGGYFGGRKYFGRASEAHPFTGHHVGAYMLMLTHDVEWGGRGYQMPEYGFGGGLEYGYSAPIGRRLHLDFSVGAGFQDGTYKEYLPIEGHYVWQSTHKRHWFGPTKAEVSLVWLLGPGNSHPSRRGLLVNE